ncbi:fructokinase [Fischerella thermalis CCMEE 5330]|uniref:Fructokinase n=1 Tax=Fischerella thermalis CCMEE 5330 TaxID=2019670 RepID=A0A2N6MNP5_9CYAN|nr:fructokinase [Fischerella thermalis CCMEE 5330]
MSVLCFGELLIDFVALESGVTVGEASGFIKAAGGAPANVAVAVARLGLPAAFMGKVGDDPFGHYLVGLLKANDVDTAGCVFDATARTALAFVSLTAEGDRSFMFYRHPSADMLMRPDEVSTAVIQRYRAFHFGSISLIGEPSRSATLHAVQTAQDAGLLISYDPNLRLALWPDEAAARAGMLIGLDYAHVVKISAEEVEFLLGTDDISGLWRPQMKLIMVTHGPDGATFYTRTSSGHVPGFKVNAVDTTGAGDSFLAATLTKLLEHGDAYEAHLTEITRYACMVGALTTLAKGGIPALPTREQVEAFAAAS